MNRQQVPDSSETVSEPGHRNESPDRCGELVAGFHIVRRIAEDPRTSLYEAVRGSERGYLRVVRHSVSQELAIATRLLESAKLLRRIRFPGLARILETGTLPDGCIYVLMQPSPGELLSERIRRGASLAPLARALGPLAKGLALLHSQGLYYLGIEPERIQVPAGAEPALQLLDSELAGSAAMQPRPPAMLNRPVRSIVDPVLFMAPEMLRAGTDLGPPADVYALGALAYLVLCGRPPVRAGSTDEVAAATSDVRVPLRSVAPGIPEALAHLVEAMLDKDPAGRPPMAHVADRWLALASELATMPAPEPPPIPPEHPPVQPPSPPTRAQTHEPPPVRAQTQPGLPPPGRPNLVYLGIAAGALVALFIVISVAERKGDEPSPGVGPIAGPIDAPGSAGEPPPPPPPGTLMPPAIDELQLSNRLRTSIEVVGWSPDEEQFVLHITYARDSSSPPRWRARAVIDAPSERVLQWEDLSEPGARALASEGWPASPSDHLAIDGFKRGGIADPSRLRFRWCTEQTVTRFPTEVAAIGQDLRITWASSGAQVGAHQCSDSESGWFFLYPSATTPLWAVMRYMPRLKADDTVIRLYASPSDRRAVVVTADHGGDGVTVRFWSRLLGPQIHILSSDEQIRRTVLQQLGTPALFLGDRSVPDLQVTSSTILVPRGNAAAYQVATSLGARLGYPVEETDNKHVWSDVLIVPR